MDLVAGFIAIFVLEVTSSRAWLVSGFIVRIDLLLSALIFQGNSGRSVVVESGLTGEGLNGGSTNTFAHNGPALDALERTTDCESVTELGPLDHSVLIREEVCGGIKIELNLQFVGNSVVLRRFELDLELLEAFATLLGRGVSDLPLVIGELLLEVVILGGVVLGLGQIDLKLVFVSLDRGWANRWVGRIHRWEELRANFNVVDLVEDVLEILLGPLVVDQVDSAAGPGELLVVIFSLVVVVVIAPTEQCLILRDFLGGICEIFKLIKVDVLVVLRDRGGVLVADLGSADNLSRVGLSIFLVNEGQGSHDHVVLHGLAESNGD